MKPTTTRALVLEGNGELVVKAVPVPEPTHPHSVLIRVTAAGVCGSDLPRAFGDGAYHYPLIMGHEFSGVVEIADSDLRYSRGDNVAIFPLIPCHRCVACSTGAYAQCHDYDYLGSRSDGGFAEYVWVPVENLISIPAHLDPVHAALTEPVAVALHCVNRLKIQPGGRGVVFGGGLIGLLAALWLRIRGCAEVFVVEIDSRKLSIAKRYGFVPIDAGEGDPVRAISNVVAELAGGSIGVGVKAPGVQYAIEACGLAITYRQSLEVVDDFGQVALMGNIKDPLTFAPEEVSSMLRREITVVGSWNSSVVPRGTDDWSVSLSSMDRTIDVKPLISHRISLADAPELLRSMWRGEVSHMRVVILPNDGT